MASSHPPPHLRLVGTPPPVAQPDVGTQLSLPLELPTNLILVNMMAITTYAFVSFVEHERPEFLFDVRPAPTFGLDGFSRRAAFLLFSKHRIAYLDLSAVLGIAGRYDAAVSSGRVAECITEVLVAHRVEPRCLGLLLEETQAAAWLNARLHEAIRPRPKTGWKVDVIPRQVTQIVR